jgi:hypothetical protein
MVAAGQLLRLGEEVVEVALPPGRVLALAQALDLGGVQHALYRGAEPGAGLARP